MLANSSQSERGTGCVGVPGSANTNILTPPQPNAIGHSNLLLCSLTNNIFPTSFLVVFHRETLEPTTHFVTYGRSPPHTQSAIDWCRVDSEEQVRHTFTRHTTRLTLPPACKQRQCEPQRGEVCLDETSGCFCGVYQLWTFL
ncbi:unnamed protein product [Pleuronectes platessa]|uniref:Uncharacterized protein n=1 Tax=Pleuronectes platessa TaxID=8262 RepID=A0A9N7YX81_PLEPL|nr:unnamed protein product [Pleuronectes platessa]